MFGSNYSQFMGCFIGGLIGDAVGAMFENQVADYSTDFSLVAYPWFTTDDTQLTLATCEAIEANCGVFPEKVAGQFLRWFQQNRLIGLGSTTLQALQGLQVGGHWALVGRSGEFAAGNGAAMRIAPLVFVLDPAKDRLLVKDVCNITHKNDEAYVGALAVLIALHYIKAGLWNNDQTWDHYIINTLPDTKVKDALKIVQQLPDWSIEQFAQQFGSSGYVVETVPLAILAASKVKEIGFTEMLKSLIRAGGDTDTTCSIAGQLAGTWLGLENLPKDLVAKAKEMKEYDMFHQFIKPMPHNTQA